MDVGLNASGPDKAALRGEPSYVWRQGQARRLEMIRAAAEDRRFGVVLDNGCGVGAYLERLAEDARLALGVEIEADRAALAAQTARREAKPAGIVRAAGEALPFRKETVDLILSHEVLEHVSDDRRAAAEMVRVLKPGGRLVVFVPNRAYPFETHGIYWRGRYRFGNIPFVNYLPSAIRNQLAPHVRAYRARDLAALFAALPVRPIRRTIVYGAYDNIIARRPWLGRVLRGLLQTLERTPLRAFGLSHFWVLERD
jgi:SAM-dependent methyltransferase